MDARQTVIDSVVMVQQMAGAPKEVAAVLDLEGREKLLKELPLLIERADEVRRTGDRDGVLDLAKDVHRLVEGIPTLAELFPISQVGIRLSANHQRLDNRFSGEQAQEQAAQILNSVVELNQGIKKEIHKWGQRSDDEHGQTSPSS